jgi:formate dehydrogenase subunit gamma
MSGAVDDVRGPGRRTADAVGETTVHEDEILRHPAHTRVLHWLVAIFFVPALLSGFAIYTPWLFHWLTPLFGGGPMTRLLHPWFSLGFVIAFAAQLVNWAGLMRWTSDDTRWVRRIREYVTHSEAREPEYVGFFNGGQKMYFWTIAGSALLFLLTGLPMWFPQSFGRVVVAVSYPLHDVAGLVMLVGFIVHIYQSTAAIPGTFRSMTRGVVHRSWAWTHHPRWYREATGRDVTPPVDRR